MRKSPFQSAVARWNCWIEISAGRGGWGLRIRERKGREPRVRRARVAVMAMIFFVEVRLAAGSDLFIC